MAVSQITIESILSPALTLCGLPGSSKKRILEQIAKCVSETYPELDENTIFNNLVSRERLGSTGIGQGIAIPHCRLESSDQVIGCLLTTQEKIPFDAIDNQPVDLLFVLIVPAEATSEHLDLLSQLAEKFNNRAFCDRLRSCQNGQQLYDSVINN